MDEAGRTIGELAHATGLTVRALRHYEELSTNLQAHLGVGPAPETARLRSELLAKA